MASRTIVLINSGYGGGMLLDGTDTTSYNQPPNLVDFSVFDQLTWMLSIDSAATGTPTTWSLTAKFQYRQMHAGSTYRFQTPRWSDLSDEEIASHVVEGVGWYGPGQADPGGSAGIIANESTSLASPLTVRRTLRNFPTGVRLVLTVAQTGGTSAKIPLGLEVHCKGR